MEIGTRNVFTVFSLLPTVTKPPVAMGASKPIEKAPTYATSVHGDDGLGRLYRFRDDSGRHRYPEPLVTLSSRNALDEILFQISASPEPVTLVTLGPLTNIAGAIKKDSALMARLKRIILMGGAVRSPGNVTPAAEFNVYTDPHAASIVFQAGIPLTMIGLDVTRRVRFTPKVVSEKIAPRCTVLSQFICDSTGDLFAFTKEREGMASVALHDPLALGVAIDPSFVSVIPLHVEIETKGGLTEGMTVADERPLTPAWKKPPNAEVCLEVDASRFLLFFLDRLCPRAPQESRS